MSSVTGVAMALPLLVLAACSAPAEPDDRSAPSTSPTSTMAPKPHLDQALSALRKNDPVRVVYVLSQSSAKIIDARGSWDPSAKAASLRVSVYDPFGSGRQAQGQLRVVEGDWYRASGRRCWVRTDPTEFADWLPINAETLGLGTRMIEGAAVTDVSPASPDVIVVDFQLQDLVSVLGLRPADPTTVSGHVPGEVTVVDGRVSGWSFDGEDIAQGAHGQIPSKLANELSEFALDMEVLHERTEAIRKPTPDELTSDQDTPCAAAGPSKPA